MDKSPDVRGADVECSVAEQEGRRQACAVSFIGYRFEYIRRVWFVIMVKMGHVIKER